jgi:hypothetical protein
VFDSDSTAAGKSVMNRTGLALWPKLRFGLVTYIGDGGIGNGDTQLFYDAWETVTSYKVEENKLWFLYNKKRNYLLFKLIEQ